MGIIPVRGTQSRPNNGVNSRSASSLGLYYEGFAITWWFYVVFGGGALSRRIESLFGWMGM